MKKLTVHGLGIPSTPSSDVGEIDLYLLLPFLISLNTCITKG